MKKVKTTVNYKVPEWGFCNCSKLGKPTKDMCRFCVKSKGKYVCVLHNIPLDTHDGVLIKKDNECLRATAGFPSEVEDNDVQVDPKTVMKMTMQEYRKAYNKFVSQGYPDAMADRLAQQLILGGM